MPVLGLELPKRKHSIHLAEEPFLQSEDMEFGFTWKTKETAILEKEAAVLWMKGKLKGEIPAKAEIVVSIRSADKALFYTHLPLEDKMQTKDWQTILWKVDLPVTQIQDAELAVYVRNRGKARFWTDDFQFGIR